MSESLVQAPASKEPSVHRHRLLSGRQAVRRLLETMFGRRIVERLPYSRTTYRLVAWSTSVPPDTEQRIAKVGVTLRRGTARDIDKLEGAQVYDDCEVYREWLNEGQWLVVADDGGMPVTYSWLDFSSSFQLEDLPEFQFEPGPYVCYSHEAWTMPSHRGRSLRQHVFTTELLLARQAGKRWVLGYQFKGQAIEDVLRNFERIGIPRGTVVADVSVIQILGLRITRHRSYGYDELVRVTPARRR